MSVVAGIDVGNATTEVLLGRTTPGGIEVIGSGRSSTRRVKGTLESLRGAVTLVRRLERQHGIRVTAAVAAPLRPVATSSASLPEDDPQTGRLRIAASGVATAGGRGFGAGRPVPLAAAPPGEDRVVVVVEAGVGYARILAEVAPLITSGRLAAVLIEDDEGVLVANRLPVAVPVVDEVDPAVILAAQMVAVEVSEGGQPLAVLTDPLKLRVALGLSEQELGDAANLASGLFDARNAVVTLGRAARRTERGCTGWIYLAGEGRVPFLTGHECVKTGVVGLARAFALPPDCSAHDVDDLWTVDLASVSSSVQARRAATRSRPVSLAALQSSARYVDPALALAELLQVPARTVVSEVHAARAGALSTPGAGSDVVVVDLGGGTIDAVSAASDVVAAGAGDLLTASVAALTGVSAAAAEWVKRGPAFRVDAPQVLLAEDGGRTFLDQPAPSDAVGTLAVRGPVGLLPFSRTMAPAEWRALRVRIKTELIGGNVARALRTLDELPRTVIVAGGLAGDDEVLAAVSGALPAGTAIGRANVAAGAGLGHRYAVAYGLLLVDASGGSSEPSAR